MTKRASFALLTGLLALACLVQAAMAQTTDLIFSEYIEGSSYNKAIEIYNGTGAQVDLSSYSVKLFANGHTTADSTLALTGTLADGDVYVIANSQADAAILNVADTTSGVAGFNGDDALTLLKGSNVIDSIGQVGTDPGSAWGSGSTSTKDHTLRRKPTICSGDSNDSDAFDPATEWDGYAKDTFDDLGQYTSNCSGSGSVILSVADVSQAEGDSGTTTFSFTVSLSNPAPVGGVSFDIATADGTATTADNDYVGHSVTGATIAEGNSGYTFDVSVNGDTTPESDETFAVNVSNVSGATNSSASATGTIENDDILDAEIFDIQGSGDASLLTGTRVRTSHNIVTAVGPAGFYMQTPDARDDNNALTSNGVYVYTGGAPTVSVGDDVSLDADVDEFYSLTELKNIGNLIVNSSGNALPAAIALDAAIPSPDPNALSCGSTNFECMEGMLVSIAKGIITRANQSFSGDPYAEVVISASGKRSLREPGLNFGLTPTTGDNDAAGVWDGNPEIFEMDADALLPAFANVAFTGGSTFVGEGVISYNFGDYQFLPSSLTMTYNAPMPGPVADAGDSAILRIGDFNVERFCDDVDDVSGGSETYECAGNTVPTTAEYQLKTARLSDYIGNVLKLPDIVALEEVENIAVLQALANKIDADFGLTYTPQLIEGHDPSGIDVGYLVNTARVQITDVQQLAASDTWNDPNSGPGAFVHDHPPLLFKGLFTGNALNEPFMLIAVHMKSRGKVDDGGAASDRDREKRLRQAYSLALQVQQLQTDSANAGIPLTVLGDFNDYEFSDGFVDITGMVSGRYDFAANLWDLSDIGQTDQNVVNPKLWDAVYSLPDNQRYSYLYTENFGNIQGFSPRKLPTNQVLDHALLSDAARANFVSMQYGRADEDAADTVETVSSSAIGVSDHDGFVLQMTFDRIFADGFENRD